MTDRGLKQLKEPLRQVQKEIGDLLGLLQRGGPGSGHHGHAGRPGEVGGSAPSGKTAVSKKRMSTQEARVIYESFNSDENYYKSINRYDDAHRFMEWDIARRIGEPVEVGFGRVPEFRDSVSGVPEGLYVRTESGTVGLLVLGEANYDGNIYLRNFDVEPKGTGLGTAIMETLRIYSKGRGRKLTVYMVANTPFFRRFDWLREEDRDLFIMRHYGPGPHPGTGTSQDVHAGLRGTGYFSWQDRYIEHIPKHMGRRDIPEGMIYQPARWLGLHSEGFGDVFRELAKAHDYTGGRIDWSYIEEKIQRFEKDISYKRDREWIFEGELSPADEARRNEMLTLWREFPGAMPPALEVARQLNLRLLERDETGVILAISDIRSFQKSGALLMRHYGPGPHPGTGTTQDVHGGGRGYRKIPFDRTYATAPIGLRRLAKKEQQETGEFRWAYWDLSDPDDPHTKMFENKEAAMEFVAEKIRRLDYEIHYSFSDATMIFDHTQNKPHNISFNRQDVLALIELSKRPENTNIINMHNHPPQKSGIDIPPSFSDFDFAMGQQKTNEWWVVTPTGKYVVTREERGIPFFSGSDVYQLENDWNSWTEQNVKNYFPDLSPLDSVQLKASRDPEAGKKFVEMRLELIQKEVEDGGYFDVEWIPNE